MATWEGGGGGVEWLAAYPAVAYALVGGAAFCEALPVVGALVPGSVLIIAVRALVPRGTVALWPLLLGAVLGAILGDGFSYWLGRR